MVQGVLDVDVVILLGQLFSFCWCWSVIMESPPPNLLGKPYKTAPCTHCSLADTPHCFWFPLSSGCKQWAGKGVCVCVKRMSGRLGERGEVEKTCPRDRGSESTLVRVICRKQAQGPHAGPHLPGFLSLWPMLDFFYVCYVSVKWCLKSHSLQTLLASVAGSSVMSPSCQGPLSLSSCLVVLRGQPVWHIILHLSNVSSSAACHYLNCVLNWPLWGRWLFLFY